MEKTIATLAERICKERDRNIEQSYKEKVIIAINTVEALLESIKPIIIHEHLNYIERQPTLFQKFFDTLAQLNTKEKP